MTTKPSIAMMTEDQLHLTYMNVCDAPAGSSLVIHHLPEFLHSDPFDNYTGHVHSFYEILWFQGGGGTHRVDFEDYPLEDNTLFFLAPGQVHHFVEGPEPRGVLIQFCSDFMRGEQADEDIFLKYDVFNAQSSPLCRIGSGEVERRLLALVGAMEDEVAQRRAFGHVDMLRSLVRQFLILVYRHGERRASPHLDALRPSHRLFAQFRQRVEHDFTRCHEVGAYARALNVSARTLSNSVSECAGVSPLTLINNRIVLEARRLLRHSPLMVKEVAQRLGYDDTSHFIKFFRRRTGVSPMDYRNGAAVRIPAPGPLESSGPTESFEP